MPKDIKILLIGLFSITILIIVGMILTINKSFYFGADISKLLKKKDIVNISKSKINQTEIERPENDFDNDGLSDIEEGIYRTSPINSDTDQDGFLDGEEVLSGCYPTIPAPDDCPEKITKAEAEENLTEKITDLILGGVLSGDLSQENPNSQKYSSILIEEIKSKTGRLFYIDDSEINFYTTQNESAKTRQEYVNSLGLAVEKYIVFESQLFNNQTNQENSKEKLISDFKRANELIDILYKDISNLSPPNSWKEIHQDILRLIKETQINYRVLGNFDKDPVKAFLALGNVQKINKNYKDVILKSINKIKEQNLSLPSNNILKLLTPKD